MVCEPPQSRDDARFHVLLTERQVVESADDTWIGQFQRLLAPQGVEAHIAHTGEEAIGLAESNAIHAAVIDLSLPVGEKNPSTVGSAQGGLVLLQLLKRLPQRPPVVVLRGPAESRRHAERLLHEALRLGAFSVMDKPVRVDRLLATFRRLVDRQYRGHWPTAQEPESGDAESSPGSQRLI